MAQIKPFRAVRYDERRAGPIASLLAPPYDVIDDAARERYRARSPYNVVHLTLPDEEADPDALWRRWLDEGVLVRDDEPALGWLEQSYVGPDAVRRTREGLVCALRAEAYEANVVLPHERTHAGPKAGRLRLLRALRAHVEPIFCLYEGALAGPGGAPEVDVELEGVRNRLWRAPGPPPDGLTAAQLLIADGHHRYETALVFHGEDGTEESAWLLAVVVPTEQEGLTIFPTHRLARSIGGVSGRVVPTVAEGLAALPGDRSGTVLYRDGRVQTVTGEPGEPDSALVERLGPEGVTYTPSLDDAVSAVDRGRAEAALLVRAPPVDLVFELALAGRTMPQKTTFFYPKLPSGLLFMPL